VRKLSWKRTRTPWDGVPGFWAAWNRFFYLFEGPAQIGTGGPDRPSRVPEDYACPICGQPMSRHVVDRGGPGERTYLHCPERVAASDSAAAPR